MAASKQQIETSSKKAKDFSIEKACESPNLIKNLCEVIETHQDENARNLGMSIIHLLKGNHDETLEYLKSLTKNHPQVPLLHRRIGEIYINQDNLETAAEHLEEALKIDKADLTVIVWLGLIHYKLGNEKKAQICFDLLKGDLFFLNAANSNWLMEEN